MNKITAIEDINKGIEYLEHVKGILIHKNFNYSDKNSNEQHHINETIKILNKLKENVKEV